MPPATTVTTLITPIRQAARSGRSGASAFPIVAASCHTQELAEYATSIHGREVLLDHNPKAAICADCHTSHNIDSVALPSTLLTITQNCGNCHEANLKSYLETYHGQVNKLGYAYTAKCFDCHGNHNIQRVNDPGSKVSPANRLMTCRQCHVDATAGFVTFEPHATTNDFARYPYTWLASKFMAPAARQAPCRSSGCIRRCGGCANTAITGRSGRRRTCAPLN